MNTRSDATWFTHPSSGREDRKKKSPSPDVPTNDSFRLQNSLARSSRATSEARHDVSPESPTNKRLMRSSSAVEVSLLNTGSGAEHILTNTYESRTGYEAQQRRNAPVDEVTRAERIASARSSRAGSEAPMRHYDQVMGGSARRSARSSRAGSEAQTDPEEASPIRVASRKLSRCAKERPGVTPTSVKLPGGISRPMKALALLSYSSLAADSISNMEKKMYHTVKESTAVFHYFQALSYPLDQSRAARNVDELGIFTNAHHDAPQREFTPQRCPTAGSTDAAATVESGGNGFNFFVDDAVTGSGFQSDTEIRAEAAVNLSASFALDPVAQEGIDESVSALTLMTVPDPDSGVPVLGVCLGDYTGHIEYLEVSTSSAANASVRKSRSLTHSMSLSRSERQVPPPSSGSVTGSIDTMGTDNLLAGLNGREVARRHSHKAYGKSINALTSVTVEPGVRCLCFLRPYSSPSMISYLTANDRVVKLFHVRREGFHAFSAFPDMLDVVGKSFMGSRYFARLPHQPTILPIKEFGPCSNSIQALSVSADGETFMTVEDLQVFWWNFEASDTSKATCIADLRPPSGVLDEVEELVTAAAFHSTHGSLFLLSRSSGILNIGDLRDPPSRGKRQYSITTQVTPHQNPISYQAYDEILCSISAASFMGSDHVVTRDYLSLKLWDLRRPDIPYAMVPVMSYTSQYLDSLYDDDSIFDRFPVAVDDVSRTVVTGLYDGAVAVWQPLNHSSSVEDRLVHYQVNPTRLPNETVDGGRVSLSDLEGSFEKAIPGQTTLSQKEVQASTAEDIIAAPDPLANKVLTVAIAPGGERFAYTSNNGKLVCIFERRSGQANS